MFFKVLLTDFVLWVLQYNNKRKYFYRAQVEMAASFLFPCCHWDQLNEIMSGHMVKIEDFVGWRLLNNSMLSHIKAWFFFLMIEIFNVFKKTKTNIPFLFRKRRKKKKNQHPNPHLKNSSPGWKNWTMKLGISSFSHPTVLPTQLAPFSNILFGTELKASFYIWHNQHWGKWGWSWLLALTHISFPTILQVLLLTPLCHCRG